MHEVHTFRRLGVPLTIARTVWMFGFQRRRGRAGEGDTLLPKPGPLPQTSHTEATAASINRIGRVCQRLGRSGERNASTNQRQPAEHTRSPAARANRPHDTSRIGYGPQQRWPAATWRRPAAHASRIPNVGGRSYAGLVTTLRDPLVQPLGKKAADTLEKVF